MFSTVQPFINEALQIAGGYYLQREDGTYYSGTFFYDPLIHAGQAIDLNGVVQGLPEGFTIQRVFGVNDLGMIAVAIRPLENMHPSELQPSDPDFLELAGLVDTADDFQFLALPDLGSHRVLPQGINHSNDVVLVDLSGLPDGPSTHIASFDPMQNHWQVTAAFAGFWGTGVSDRLENGDLFLVGFAIDAAGDAITARINLGNPGAGEVSLSPVQVDKNTTYEFESPPTVGINSRGDFVGSLKSITTGTRRGETTTSSFRIAYLYADSWEDHDVSYPKGLNDNLDFLAGGVYDEPSLLVHRDTAEPVDLLSVIDVATAPEVDWTNPDLQLSCFDLTSRIVSDDGDPANDLPIIVGIEKYRLENPYELDARHAFILMPIQAQ